MQKASFCGGFCHQSGTFSAHGDDFGARVEGEPNPQRVSISAGFGTKLIQLDMQEPQVPEEPLMQ
jgi:hypothetical protein